MTRARRAPGRRHAPRMLGVRRGAPRRNHRTSRPPVALGAWEQSQPPAHCVNRAVERAARRERSVRAHNKRSRPRVPQRRWKAAQRPRGRRARGERERGGREEGVVGKGAGAVTGDHMRSRPYSRFTTGSRRPRPTRWGRPGWGGSRPDKPVRIGITRSASGL